MDFLPRGKSKDRKRAVQLGDASALTVSYWNGGVSRPRTVRSISGTGAYIEAEPEWPAGAIVHMAFEYAGPDRSLPKMAFGVWARIIRAESDGIEIEFMMRDSGELKQFRKVLRAIREETRARKHARQEAAGGRSAPTERGNLFYLLTSAWKRISDGKREYAKEGANRRGSSLVEFALVLPLLTVLIANVVNFGGFFFAWITIENAAGTGAQYMMRSTVGLGNPAPSPNTAALLSVVTTDISSLPNNSSLALRFCTRNPSNAADSSGPPAVPSCSILTGRFSATPSNPAPDSSAEASHYVMAWVDVAYTYEAFIPLGFTFPVLGFGPIWPNNNNGVVLRRQAIVRIMQ